LADHGRVIDIGEQIYLFYTLILAPFFVSIETKLKGFFLIVERCIAFEPETYMFQSIPGTQIIIDKSTFRINIVDLIIDDVF
jgi:hypothetical protein